MEVVSLAMDTLQTAAERAASYRLGQSALRQLDRTLWVVEKCAKWAVPPPLDQDERPQPELVRPLPWVFFLMMLVALRVTRESISLLNLVMGKPPLRSADVVMYIQGKRRYLRTLKYQGNRILRARGTPPRSSDSWYSALYSLVEFTMCFRRHALCANNNTTSHSNNDEVFVVKRSKRGREGSSPVVSSESTMERLIEKMMVDLDADSDEDGSFTLTNVTSPKSDRSDFTAESDQDTFHNEPREESEQSQEGVPTSQNETQAAQELPTAPRDKQKLGETPTKESSAASNKSGLSHVSESTTVISTPENIQQEKQKLEERSSMTYSSKTSKKSDLSHSTDTATPNSTPENIESNHNVGFTPDNMEMNDSGYKSPVNNDMSEVCSLKPEELSAKDESQKFIQMECSSKIPRTPSNEPKIANGRTVKNSAGKKKGHAHGKDRRNAEATGRKNVSSSSM